MNIRLFFSFGIIFIGILTSGTSSYGAETKLEVKFGYRNGGGVIGLFKVIEGKLERHKNLIQSPSSLVIHWDKIRIADLEKKRQIYKILELEKNNTMELTEIKSKTPGVVQGVTKWAKQKIPFSAEYGFFGEDEARFLFHLNLKDFKFSHLKLNDKDLDPIIDLILTMPYKVKN